MLLLQAIGIAHRFKHIGLDGALERPHTNDLGLKSQFLIQFLKIRSYRTQTVQVNRTDGIQVDAVGNAGQVIVCLIVALVAVGGNPFAALLELLERSTNGL